MGFRTVIILNNDQSHEWDHDPDLGRKILRAAARITDFPYGSIAECVHADTITLGVVDGLQFVPVSYDSWHANQDATDTTLKLLNTAAEKLGYRLVKR